MKRTAHFRIASLVFLTTALVACKTQFLGEAKIPGGAQGCVSVCQNLGMQLAGMVVMGEYSNGCVCQVPQARSSAASEQQDRFVYVGAQGAAAAAIAGVDTQTQDDEAAAKNNASN